MAAASCGIAVDSHPLCVCVALDASIKTYVAVNSVVGLLRLFGPLRMLDDDVVVVVVVEVFDDCTTTVLGANATRHTFGARTPMCQ